MGEGSKIWLWKTREPTDIAQINSSGFSFSSQHRIQKDLLTSTHRWGALFLAFNKCISCEAILRKVRIHFLKEVNVIYQSINSLCSFDCAHKTFDKKRFSSKFMFTLFFIVCLRLQTEWKRSLCYWSVYFFQIVISIFCHGNDWYWKGSLAV